MKLVLKDYAFIRAVNVNRSFTASTGIVLFGGN